MGRMYRSLSNYKVFDYNKCDEGQVLVEGKFIGTEENNRYGNEDFLIQPEEGPTVKLWGSGHLAWQMNKLEKGAMVQVTYMGQEILESGKYKGKPSHQFDVAVAEEMEDQMELPMEEAPAKVAKKAPKKQTSAKGGPVDLSGLD